MRYGETVTAIIHHFQEILKIFISIHPLGFEDLGNSRESALKSLEIPGERWLRTLGLNSRGRYSLEIPKVGCDILG